MLQPRIRCRSCVINNRLYVAGGALVKGGKLVPIKSAEVYDPIKNTWSFVADMTTGLILVDGYVYNGMWFVEGMVAPERSLLQVYDPETDKWFKIADDMAAPRAKNPTITIGGKLYTRGCQDGCKLDLYDADTDSWVSNYIDCSKKLHLGPKCFKYLQVRNFLPLNKGKLMCLIRDNMSISVMDVSKIVYDDLGRRQFEAYHLWEVQHTFELLSERFLLGIYNYLSETTANYFIPHSQILRA
ncbi:F-box/kelch-repeat protein At1g55270-like [Papaver somniferum]|uniref:F-box/kelch-repeat protein At1g55270-like n=1 Tax=Papaver somniferum TaxID=3469 RepID=UPI000E701C22|nr:F-box/kelch-repeat protein At1g55270-like [Papaver somniferum]